MQHLFDTFVSQIQVKIFEMRLIESKHFLLFQLMHTIINIIEC